MSADFTATRGGAITRSTTIVAHGGIVAHGAAAVGAEAGGHAATPSLCLNCGTGLIGPHCHACGQDAHLHRTAGAIGHDLAHGVLHFEGSIWRTLPLLALRPGELTRRYIAGERKRFVAPLAIFLFTVFVLFGVINAVAGGIGVDGAGSPAARVKVAEEAKRQRDWTGAELGRVAAQRAVAVAAGRSTAELDRERDTLLATRRGLEMVGTGTDMTDEVHTDWPTVDHAIVKARDNPALLVYKLQSSAYKFSWVLIPLSVPFVALLFLWKRRFGLYDHSVFVTYSLTFMMMLVIALTLMGAVGLSDGWIIWPALLVPPLHLYKQLRGAYALSRRGALWRTAALLLFGLVVLVGFGVALLANGLMH